MKKGILTVFFTMFLTVGVFADKVIDPATLPDNIKTSLKNWFPNATISLVEADWNSYEVVLSNGAEIELRKNGDWKEIKCYEGIPQVIVPQAIIEVVQKNYPSVVMIKIEKKSRGYEVKLMNQMELHFSDEGKLIGQELDD